MTVPLHRSRSIGTVFGAILCGILAVLCSTTAMAGTATLTWEAPTTYSDGSPMNDLAGFRIYYGTASKNYTSNVDAGNVTTYQLGNLPDGVTVYFAVTAYNSAGLESVSSNEASKTFPATAYSLTVTAAGSGSGSVTSSPAGISCGTACSASFAVASSVTLTATPAASSTFSGWSGACTGTGSCSVTMDAAKSVTANFAVKTYTVTPSAGANGAISPSTAQTVNHNATTSFTVTPVAGYRIVSVTGCGGTLNGSTYTTGPVTANCTVSASFVDATAGSLTVSRSGNGTVTSTPAGIDCGQICSNTYTGGTSVTLTAVPAAGWNFSGWSGACTGTGTCTVIVNGPTAVTAMFRDGEPPVLKVSSLPDGAVTKNADLNISGTVTDNSGLQSLLINGTAVTVAPDSTFSHLITMTDGKNTIWTVATDQAGNTASDSRTITLDRTAPGLSITAPADNSATANALLTVSGTVDETASVSVRLNSGSSQLASMNGTTFTATVTLRSGLNTITVTATDGVGNTSSSIKRTVTYDDQKPSVSITEPPSDVTTAQNSVAVQGRITDSLTASTAAITIDGITTALALNSGGYYSTTANLSAEGLHTVTVTATNLAGVGTSVQRNIQFTKLGDLNGSGAVDLADAVLAFRHVTGDQQLTDALIRKRCDVAPLGADGKPHPDGVIDLGDVVIILRKVVGLVNW